MSDIKLFRTELGKVTQLEGKSVALEKSLQELIEKNLQTFLGIRFLATEYGTGKTHAGRIDTLGLDENNCPCIIEYKRSTNENVINQACTISTGSLTIRQNSRFWFKRNLASTLLTRLSGQDHV